MRNVYRSMACAAVVMTAGLMATPAFGALSLLSMPFEGTQSPYVFNAASSVPLSTTHFSLAKVGTLGSLAPNSGGITVGPLYSFPVTFRVTLVEPATQIGFMTGGFITDNAVLTAVTLSNGSALSAPTTLATGLSFIGVSDNTPFTTATFTFKSTFGVNTANSVTLTDFRFLTAPAVPEPAAVGMLAAVVSGGLLLRKRSRIA